MMGMDYQWPSLPTCISSSVILRWRPRSCCWRAVFSPLREVICCWMRLFSAFWKLKCRFLHKLHIYISSSMRTSSLERLFLTSAVFMVSTDSRVSFSLRRICTSFLWLLSSFEMFLICCCLTLCLPRVSAACPSARPGCYRSCCLCRSSIKIIRSLNLQLIPIYTPLKICLKTVL